MGGTPAERERRLLDDGVGWTVFRLGLPLAFGMAAHALLNLVDLLLVGRLGRDAVEAAHVATTINFVPMLVGNGISVAMLAMLSRQIGRGDWAGARATHRRCQAFALWFGALVAVGSALPAAACVDTTGVTGAVRADAVRYLAISNVGCLPMFVLMQTTAAMRAVGEVLVPLLLLVAANVLNLGLDLALLFGWPALGVPALGVVGAAWATFAARAVGAAFAWWWLCRRAHPLTLRAPTDAAVPAPRVAWPLLRDAAPQVGQIGLRALLVWVLTAIVQQRAGDDATAALGITTRLDTMVLFGAVGFASAATTLAGRAVAAGRPRRARLAGLHAGLQACLFGGALIAAFLVGAPVIVSWFLPDASPAVLATAQLYLGIAALAHPLGAFALGSIGAVQGAGRMVAPLVVDLLGFLVLGALLGFRWHQQAELASVFWALVLGTAVVALLHLAFLFVGRWTSPGPALPERHDPAAGTLPIRHDRARGDGTQPK